MLGVRRRGEQPTDLLRLRTTGRRRGSRVETTSSARSWRFSVTLKKNRRAVALTLTVGTVVPIDASHN